MRDTPGDRVVKHGSCFVLTSVLIAIAVMLAADLFHKRGSFLTEQGGIRLSALSPP